MSNIKAVFKCLESYKFQFRRSSCLLTISVGQEVHEGDKLLETIKLVGKNFKKCTLLIDDSIQRHTMAINSKKEAVDFLDDAVLEGDLWLYRNREIFCQLNIPYNIFRWNHWLNHENFKKIHSNLLNEYENNEEYKSAINETIEIFLNRYISRLADTSNIDIQRSFKLCFDYLLEECTALCLWVEGRYNFEVYPSKRNQAMTLTHELFIKPEYPNLLNPVAIKFKNRKQLKPQQFISERLENEEELLLSK